MVYIKNKVEEKEERRKITAFAGDLLPCI